MMFYALRPIPKSRAQIEVRYDHIAYFFCLAAGWATLAAQAEVSLIRNVQFQQIAQETITRVAEAVQRPMVVKATTVGHRFQENCKAVWVPAVYFPVHVFEELSGYGGRMSTRLHYLKVEPNQVYTVQLKYPKPTEVHGLGGKQLRWILIDGRALYTPLFLREKFEELQIKPGMKFTIEKAVNGRDVHWKVNRPQPVQQLLDVGPSLDSPVPEPDPDEEPTYPPAAKSKLELALKSAVTAAHKAEQEGMRIGYTIRFTPSDIRAMAISVLIQMERAA